MECEVFIESINDFKSHSILYNKILEQHKRKNPNCTCDLNFLKID